jgi:hypothetical protein
MLPILGILWAVLALHFFDILNLPAYLLQVAE